MQTNFTRSAVADTPSYELGDVFAGVGDGEIKRFDPGTGALLNTLSTGSPYVGDQQTGMCIDRDGNIYATNWFDGTMSKFDLHEGLDTYPWGTFIGSPEDCKVNADGNIYVGEANGQRRLLLFDPAGTLLDSWTPAVGPSGMDSFDLDADQCTILYTSQDDRIQRYDVCTDSQLSDFATGLSGDECLALRIRPSGEVMVACTKGVHHLAPNGTVIRTYLTSEYTDTEGNQESDFDDSFFFAMNLDPDGTSFWTGGLLSGDIYKIDIETGEQLTTFNAGINTILGGLAIVGEILVGDDNDLPDCTNAEPSEAVLWPPNRKLHAINVIGVTDPDGDSITINIDSIRQDEPTESRGNGRFEPDGAGIDTETAEVRAERDTPGNGRVYHIGFTAFDGEGGQCSGEVIVEVPRNNGKKGDAIDDNPDYDSTI